MEERELDPDAQEASAHIFIRPIDEDVEPEVAIVVTNAQLIPYRDNILPGWTMSMYAARELAIEILVACQLSEYGDADEDEEDSDG